MKKIIFLLCICLFFIPFAMARNAEPKLITYINSQNYDKMVKLLEKGDNPDVLTSNGELTALTVAVDNSDVKAAQILLDYGADVNARSKVNISPILRIVMRNNPEDYEMTKLLLAHGADYKAPHDFEFQINPMSLALKIKNYQAFNLFLENTKLSKCELAYYTMQGQNIKNAEHWKAVDTWKTCKMKPLNDSYIGLSVSELYKLFGKPYTTNYIDKNSYALVYVNLYSKYVDNPVMNELWYVRQASPTNVTPKIVNKVKDYKSFYIDNGIVVDIKNEDSRVDKPIMYYQPK